MIFDPTYGGNATSFIVTTLSRLDNKVSFDLQLCLITHVARHDFLEDTPRVMNLKNEVEDQRGMKNEE